MKVLTIIFLIVQAVLFGQEQRILLTFSEPMDHSLLLDADNYTIFDTDLNIVPITKVGAVKGDSAVVLFVNVKLSNKTSYAVRVQNVKDVAGNIIGEQNTAWFFFDGFNPELIKKPNVKIGRD